MLRTSHFYNHDVPENSGRVGARLRDDAMSKSTRPSLSDQVRGGVPSIPGPEQRIIYYEWISQSSLKVIFCWALLIHHRSWKASQLSLFKMSETKSLDVLRDVL